MLHRLTRAGRGGARRLPDLRLPQGRLRAVAVHEHRAVGLLLRHPQGRALLRALFQREAARRAHRHRRDLQGASRLAGAHPVVHGRGGVAGARAGTRGLGAPRNVPRARQGLAQRRAGQEMGAGARRAPRRHRRAGAGARRQAHRLEPRGGARRVCRRPRDAARARGRRAGGSVHHQRRAPHRQVAARGRLHAARRAGRGRRARSCAQGRKCARSWRILADVGADPDFPDLSPRDAAAVREFDQRAKEIA